MENQTENTMIVTNKVLVPHQFHSTLDSLHSASKKAVKQMLKNREESSSKYYKTIPCVVSKSLIAKYQKNKKCKSVRRVVIPICGDKGKQVKLEPNNQVRIPAITQKETIPIFPLRPIVGHIRSVEFFKRKGQWFMSYSYNTKTEWLEVTGFIGVDRNARGNVATVADIESGKVMRLGPDVKLWKDKLKKRKAKLQRSKTKGGKNLLVKINKKQANRTKDINHKVSREIVNYAIEHRKCIVLEDLGSIKDSKKCGGYVKKSNWAYFQLDIFITYKASLNGVPVIYVDPKNTSKMCSRCGAINSVNGKKFVCGTCGHKDHRDSNAGFNIGIRGREFCDPPSNEREFGERLIDDPHILLEAISGERAITEVQNHAK